MNQSAERNLDQSQLALALCRALIVCLVKVDDRFRASLGESLLEVAAMIREEQGGEANVTVANLTTFSRTLSELETVRLH